MSSYIAAHSVFVAVVISATRVQRGMNKVEQLRQ
jgi:hypothetical protein